MRSLLIIIGILLVVCAADVFGMGKSDGSKEEVEKSLKKEPVEVVAKPVEVEPVPVKVEPTKKPVETLAKIEPAKPAEKPDANKVVLTVNGIPVKSGEIESRVDSTMKKRMGNMRAQTPPDALKSMRERMRQGIVERLISETIIDQKVKEKKIKVTEKDVDDALQRILTKNKMTKEQFKEQLSKMGVTLETVRGQIKSQDGLVKLVAVEMKAAGEPAEATDAEVKTSFDANQKRYGESVRASHILIKADMKDETSKAEATKKIEDLLKRARAGEDFAGLAKQYSEDPGAKKTDGEYTFPRGQMAAPFEQAAFSLEVGQISDVVETQYGYHIIKLSQKIPGKAFDDVKADIAKTLGEKKKIGYWRMKLQKKYRAEAKLEWAPGEKERFDKFARPPTMRPSAPSRIKPSPKPSPK